MKILVTGRNGQVGFELERSLQSLGEVVAVDRGRMDLADLDQVRRVVREVRPDLIVNAAAYTAVDKAESEPELAMRINGEAPGVMAEEAARLGAAIIHYSTDYVFDGTKEGAYTEQDETNPLNEYGRSKLAGERAIQAAGVPHLILRTSWVYGARGKNFLLTMLKLGSERDELRVVNDQIGCPTWCRTIADVTGTFIHRLQGSTEDIASGAVGRSRSAKAIDADAWRSLGGLYHLSGRGQTTWFGFAGAIFEEAALDKPLRLIPRLVPIPATEYPVPAKRPANSLLFCEKLEAVIGPLPHWRDALRSCLQTRQEE